MEREDRKLTACRPSVASFPVAVVIPTWNSAAGVVDCIRSVIAENPAEIVVVDNGSSDETCQLVEGESPRVRIIALQENTGFAAACNRGAAETRQPYVLFLNDDTRVEPGYVRALFDSLEARPKCASAVGKLVWEDGDQRFVDSAGIQLRRCALGPIDRGHAELDCGQYDTGEEIFGPSATAALYRRLALEDVGPSVFDDSMFAYYEDVDLAWRLRRAGWRHWYEPTAVAHHQRRGPDSKPAWIRARAFSNRYLVWLRNERPERFALYSPVALSWEVARLARRWRMLPSIAKQLPTTCRLALRILRERLSGRR